METGCVHLYCGDGKGKTTAAMGLARRGGGQGGGGGGAARGPTDTCCPSESSHSTIKDDP